VSAPFRHELRVRYNESDPQGIVFNANYVAYIDLAFTELWREAFGSYQAMVERGIDMVVGELNLSFRGSARFDEMIAVELAVERLGTTSITTRLAILREERVLAEGWIRHVFLDAESWSKTPAPEWLREGLAPYLVAERS
jgi:acyl-CoA thioester hydrolase